VRRRLENLNKDDNETAIDLVVATTLAHRVRCEQSLLNRVPKRPAEGSLLPRITVAPGIDFDHLAGETNSELRPPLARA
jgi:hypothetical protein